MGVLYLIGCAAPPVQFIAGAITAAQHAGWDVCLVLTPTAARWLERDLQSLADLTGHPVRSSYKKPTDPDVLPPADAMLVAPATLNSLSKWALGIADTLALGLLTEGIGLGLPIVALPYLNAAQYRHPALAAHVRALEAVGVTVLLGDDGHQPHPPRSGAAEQFPWSAGLACLAAN